MTAAPHRPFPQLITGVARHDGHRMKAGPSQRTRRDAAYVYYRAGHVTRTSLPW